ncbi:hypothetical protein BV25DRAFT_1881615 [Artomyces pyxidatus]|uniref:Uncharacterized protein n=1 Tax=Artomyces pyxidatus TaxID=48021 RepID=A0ACB8T8W8_9AGAM|nr:hypothetical protein BV25DRAFT_1881615 [Artomyces pyxidatus]
MVSPPKPWERNGTVAAAAPPSPSPVAVTAPATTSNPTAATSASAPASTSTPSVPARPASFMSPLGATTATPFASSLTSQYSPYNRLGGTGYSPYSSSMYGGMGTMGGYGGYGSYGMGGMNGMYGSGYGGMGMGMGMGGMGMYGQPGFDPTNPNPSVTQALESTTQTTFALLHSVVQTFAGLAQMLESTFMATHSSFFALAGVVDQFAQLRNVLGSVLGLFGLVRWMRELLTGRRGARGEMRGEFRDFINGRPVQGPMPPPPKASKKPLVIFFLAVFGVPYAMHKLVKILTERAAQQQLQGQLLPNGTVLPPLDPSQLTFARALYAFAASTPSELSLQENEIVAIMGKLDPTTGMEVDPRMEVETDWWKGRTREGREGWFPRKWVEVLERRTPEGKKVD